MELKASFLFFNDLNGLPLYLENPVWRISALSFAEVPAALSAIDMWVKKNKFFLAGYIHYEVGYPLLNIPFHRTPSSHPLIDFYVFEKTTPIDSQLRAETRETDSVTQVRGAFYNFSEPQSRILYEERLARVKHQLQTGNSYQVNYTFLNSCNSFGETKDLFLNLYEKQKSRYAVCAELAGLSIMSLSPELFFSKVKEKITTKPMKGTLPLGPTEIPAHLHEKLSAENLMIVDLLRNDLSKVAKPETVNVTKMMQIEQYATLQQIVSTIEAELEPTVQFSQIIKALFPCGSITGAPKRRTMEILQDLESESRGLYTGTVGYIEPSGDMQFNVAIRTLWGSNQKWSYGIGGGIVLDSIAADEHAEAVLKAQYIKATNSDFHLFETMLFTDSKVCDLEQHLSRLRQSARMFAFSLREEEVRSRLQEVMISATGQKRIKLQLFIDGRIEVFVEPLQPTPDSPRVLFSETRSDSKNIFYQHKTSERFLYESEFLIGREKGFYDVIFLNERGELTEASRHNVFIRKGSEWFTPPLACGLLAGVQRGKFLREKNAQEKILFKEDIFSASEVVLTNSLRGAVTVEVVR